MQEKAQKFYDAHKAAFENWDYGDISKVWTDENGNICIEYESGRWWHYAIDDNDNIIFW